MTAPRFRFAPSPTGDPHIGNLHTALFSWALARSLGGDFVIRIEDTDVARDVAGSAGHILDTLRWLGLDWDEGPDVGGDYGPYVQSLRRPRHEAVMRVLLAEGHAYYGADVEPAPGRAGSGSPGQPLRLRMPRGGSSQFFDALRGPVTIANDQFDDPIIARRDGAPLYHLAAVTDDHDMAISHVVRGEEWLPTTPIHRQLYQAMGWPEPVWIHLPLIRDRHGQKLKKRDPAGGYLVSDLQAAGYLPEALFNYLLLLGWSPDGEQEIINRHELRRQFRLERLSRSPAIFDWARLRWVNRQYLSRLSDAALADLIRPYLEDACDELPVSDGWLLSLTALIRESLDTLADAPAQTLWACRDDLSPDNLAETALAEEPAGPVLAHLAVMVSGLVLLDRATAASLLGELRRHWGDARGWSPGAVLVPVRAALTGTTQGPPLDEVMGLLGRARTLRRLARALHQRAG